jgi:hypothetical protein
MFNIDHLSISGWICPISRRPLLEEVISKISQEIPADDRCLPLPTLSTHDPTGM